MVDDKPAEEALNETPEPIVDGETPEPIVDVEIPEIDEDVMSEDAVGQPAKFSRMNPNSEASDKAGIELIMDVSTTVSVELGRSSMVIKDVMDLGPGSIIELNKLAGEPVDILINDKLIARGEVIVINENFGVRVTEILGMEQRIKSLG